MTQVTDHYKFSPAGIEFVNVHVDLDRRLFVDPSAIRNDRTPLGRAAHRSLTVFFRQVLKFRLTGDARGLQLLNNLHEPNQTRLGYSIGRPKGTAWGDELAGDLWDRLAGNPLVQYAVLRELEHLPLFLDKVGKDLVSDLTTRVVFDQLIDFTRSQMTKHPALSTGAVTVKDLPVFNVGTKTWATRTETIPHASRIDLLLVPLRWVTPRLEMNSTAFYNRFSTEVVQQERTPSGGKVRPPSKKSIKQEFPDKRGLNSAKSLEYKNRTDGNQRDLVLEYQQWADSQFDVMTADRAKDYLA